MRIFKRNKGIYYEGFGLFPKPVQAVDKGDFLEFKFNASFIDVRHATIKNEAGALIGTKQQVLDYLSNF